MFARSDSSRWQQQLSLPTNPITLIIYSSTLRVSFSSTCIFLSVSLSLSGSLLKSPFPIHSYPCTLLRLQNTYDEQQRNCADAKQQLRVPSPAPWRMPTLTACGRCEILPQDIVPPQLGGGKLGEICSDTASRGVSKEVELCRWCDLLCPCGEIQVKRKIKTFLTSDTTCREELPRMQREVIHGGVCRDDSQSDNDAALRSLLPSLPPGKFVTRSRQLV